MKLSVIIPAYNERKTILKILNEVEKTELPENLDKEIIIIDDFSTDGTRDIVKGLSGKHKVFFQDRNRGKGAAIKTGIKEASGDFIIIQDADMEYSPSEYPRLLPPLLNGEADVVYGSRFLKRGHRPKYRLFYLGNKFLSFLSSVLYGKRISDMETCYKVFRSEVIKNINIKSNRFDFEPEITAKLIKAGRKIKEVPISYNSRGFADGKKIGWRDGVVAIYVLIKYKFID